MVVGTENAHAAADWVRVHQVLRNPVSNALLHSDDHIAVDVSKLEGVARITLGNDGPAISAAKAARIFDPHATQHARPTGSGAMEGAHLARYGAADGRRSDLPPHRDPWRVHTCSRCCEEPAA